MSRFVHRSTRAQGCSAAIRRSLSPHIDGELCAEDRRAVDAHLRACAACRAEHEALSRAARAVSRLHIPPSVARPRTAGANARPAGFAFRSGTWLAQTRAAARLRTLATAKISLPVPVAAALVVLAVAAFFAFRSSAPVAVTLLPPITKTEIIEVPVEREVVREVVREARRARPRTRIIYIERANESRSLADEADLAIRAGRGRTRNKAARAGAPGAQTARGSSLEGFRPARDANLRVIADGNR